MKLQDLLNDLPDQYSAEKEQRMIEEVNNLKVHCLTDQLTTLLAFAITEHYNQLARTILEKDYQGKTLDLQAINRAILSQNQSGYSILHFIAQFGNKEMLIYFLEQGVEITLDHNGWSPLHALAYADNLTQSDYSEIIELMENKSPNLIQLKDKKNLLAIHHAAHQNNMEFLKALAATPDSLNAQQS